MRPPSSMPSPAGTSAIRPRRPSRCRTRCWTWPRRTTPPPEASGASASACPASTSWRAWNRESRPASARQWPRSKAAGAIVEEVSLPHTDYGLATYYIVAPAEASANLARYDGIRYGFNRRDGDTLANELATRGQGFGAEVKRRIMLGTYALSAGYYDAYYLKAQKVRTLIKADFDRLWAAGFDALVAPTSPTVAFRFGARLADPVSMYLSDACTLPVNMAGLPGVSIPCGLSEGLPVGLQLIGAAVARSRAARPGPRLRGDHRRRHRGVPSNPPTLSEQPTRTARRLAIEPRRIRPRRAPGLGASGAPRSRRPRPAAPRRSAGRRPSARAAGGRSPISNREPCQGHSTQPSTSVPSLSGPPAWAHCSCSARIVLPVRTRTRAWTPALALTRVPSAISVTSSRCHFVPARAPGVAIDHVAQDDRRRRHRRRHPRPGSGRPRSTGTIGSVRLAGPVARIASEMT